MKSRLCFKWLFCRLKHNRLFGMSTDSTFLWLLMPALCLYALVWLFLWILLEIGDLIVLFQIIDLCSAWFLMRLCLVYKWNPAKDILKTFESFWTTLYGLLYHRFGYIALELICTQSFTSPSYPASCERSFPYFRVLNVLWSHRAQVNSIIIFAFLVQDNQLFGFYHNQIMR